MGVCKLRLNERGAAIRPFEEAAKGDGPEAPAAAIQLARLKLEEKGRPAHRAAVEDCVRLLQTHALFTRVGCGGAAQVPVRGAVAAGFDHWDTRTGDPNLHTHLVVANKVQGLDGRWRSIDAKALYAATVAVSEVYDCLIADAVAHETGARWSLRDRGERRSPAFEIDGVDDVLLAEFSTRSTDENDIFTDPEIQRITQIA